MKPIYSLILLFHGLSWAKPMPHLVPHTWVEHGLHVVYLKRSHLPMADIRLIAPAGSAYDAPKGIAFLTGHAIDQGTPKRNQEEIARRFESVGAQYQQSISTDMAISGIRTLTDDAYLKPALENWLQILHHPTFPDPSIKKLKSAMQMRQKQSEERPQAIAHRMFMHALYPHHPYAHTPFTFDADTRSLTSKDLQHFYHQHYQTHRCHLIMVGNLSLQQAKHIALKVAQALPHDDVKPIPMLPKAPSFQPNHLQKSFQSEQTTLMVGQLGIAPGNIDRLNLQVGSHILGGGMTSELFESLRNQHGLTYSIYSGFDMLQMKGPFVIQAQIRKGKHDQARDLILKTTADFIRKGPSSKQTHQAKDQMRHHFLRSIATNDALVSTLSYLAFYHQPYKHLSTYLDRLDQVSAHSIHHAMQKNISPKHWLIVEVGALS